MEEGGTTPDETNGIHSLEEDEPAPAIDPLKSPASSEGPSGLRNTYRNEDPTDETEEDEEEEDESNPQFECGIILCLLPGGGGVRFEPLTGPEYARAAGLTDLNMLANHLADHTRAVMAGTQVSQMIGKKVRIGKGIRR